MRIITIPRPEGARDCKIHHEWVKMDITSGVSLQSQAPEGWGIDNPQLHQVTFTIENQHFFLQDGIFWEIAI